jgi:hypothetical protein
MTMSFLSYDPPALATTRRRSAPGAAGHLFDTHDAWRDFDFDFSADFDPQLAACVEAMNRDDAVGQTLAFARERGRLCMYPVQITAPFDARRTRFEMLLFDAQNTSGERWQQVFFPAQRIHCFVPAP